MTIELTLTRNIPASVEVVFDAWLDPKALAQFMLPGEAMSVPEVKVDAKVGGEFTIVMKAGEKLMPHTGSYKSIERPNKLSFTWFSLNAQSGSLVTLSFEAKGENETELTLHHEGFETEESRSNHEGGWGRILGVLAKLKFA